MGKKARNKFPTFTPKNKRTHTATVDLDTYIEKWTAFRNEALKKGELSKKTWGDFNKEYGDFIDENGLKYKPGLNNGRPGKLSTSVDYSQSLRKWRGEVLTYMFGGTPIDSAKFGEKWMTGLEVDEYGYPIDGVDVEAHHWYGNAEAAPWIDDIIDEHFNGDKSTARAMIESGRAYFEDSPFFLGDVQENYRLFTGPQHTGRDSKKIAGMFPELSIHGRLGPDWGYGTDVTASMGRSPLVGNVKLHSHTVHEDIDLDKSAFHSRPPGVKGQNTAEYIRERPWSKEETLRFVEDEVVGGKARKGPYLKDPIPDRSYVNRWSSFWDHIEQSGGIRDELVNEVLNNPKLKTRRQLGLETVLDLEPKFKNLSAKFGKADALTNFGVGVATGNYLQALGGGAGLVLTDEKNQAKIAKQFTKRLGKSGLKLIPGLDIGLSGLEAYGYLTEGKFDQMGIALASGAIGWVPVVGDAAAAALDLTNTTLDITRMDWNRQGDVDTDADLDRKKAKYSILDEYSPNTRSFRSLKL